MDPAQLVEASDRALTSFMRHQAATAPAGSFEDDDRYLIFAGGHDYPGTHINGVMCRSPDISAGELLARADAFFTPLRRQYLVWVRQHADADLETELVRRKMWVRPPPDGIAGIAIDQMLEPLSAPDGIDLGVASTDDEFTEFRRLIGDAYQLVGADEALLEQVLFSVESLRSDRVVGAHCACAAGILSAGMIYVDGDVASLQWTATRASARGRGLGRLVMHRCSNAALARGATSAFGAGIDDGTAGVAVARVPGHHQISPLPGDRSPSSRRS